MLTEFKNSVEEQPEINKRVIVVLFEESIVTGGKVISHPNHGGVVVNLDSGGYAEYYYGWAYPKIDKFQCNVIDGCSFKCPSCK